MAAVYSNSLGLYNLTAKTTPTTSDILPLGDAAVTGTPLKQATVGNIVKIVPKQMYGYTIVWSN